MVFIKAKVSYFEYVLDGAVTIAIFSSTKATGGLAEVDAGGNVLISLKYWQTAYGRLEQKQDGSFESYYNLTDHLGSTRVILREDGIAVAGYDFYPFGMLMPGRDSQGDDRPKQLFTGKERDEETGFDYFGARYYSSEIGRWLGVDPMEEFFSGYLYVGNNPINLVDPFGLMSEGVGGGCDPATDPDCYDGGNLAEDGDVVVEAKRDNSILGKTFRFFRGVGKVVQTGIDVAGIIPVFGDALDLVGAGFSAVKAGVYFLAGDKEGAKDALIDVGLGLVAAIPVVGSVVAGGTKLLKNADNIVGVGRKIVRRFDSKRATKLARKNGIEFDENIGAGIPTTSTNINPENPDAIKSMLGAKSPDYYFDIDVTGKKYIEKRTKAGHKEYIIQESISKKDIMHSGRVKRKSKRKR